MYQVSLLFEVTREEPELSAAALSSISGRRSKPHAQLRPKVDVAVAYDAPVAGIVNLNEEIGPAIGIESSSSCISKRKWKGSFMVLV